MTINFNDKEQIIIITLAGKLDGSTVKTLQDKLASFWDNIQKDIVLDFADLSYISSAGLRVLLMTEKKTRAAGYRLTINNANQMIREIFDVTGFSSVLSIV
jgi:anti-anti-sigma factor